MVSSKKEKKTREVYCFCRRPDQGEFMICCDNCNEWYHGSCINISEREGKRLKKYYCPNCEGESRRNVPEEGVEDSDEDGTDDDTGSEDETPPEEEERHRSSKKAKREHNSRSNRDEAKARRKAKEEKREKRRLSALKREYEEQQQQKRRKLEVLSQKEKEVELKHNRSDDEFVPSDKRIQHGPRGEEELYREKSVLISPHSHQAQEFKPNFNNNNPMRINKEIKSPPKSKDIIKPTTNKPTTPTTTSSVLGAIASAKPREEVLDPARQKARSMLLEAIQAGLAQDEEKRKEKREQRALRLLSLSTMTTASTSLSGTPFETANSLPPVSHFSSVGSVPTSDLSLTPSIPSPSAQTAIAPLTEMSTATAVSSSPTPAFTSPASSDSPSAPPITTLSPPLTVAIEGTELKSEQVRKEVNGDVSTAPEDIADTLHKKEDEEVKDDSSSDLKGAAVINRDLKVNPEIEITQEGVKVEPGNIVSNAGKEEVKVESEIAVKSEVKKEDTKVELEDEEEEELVINLSPEKLAVEIETEVNKSYTKDPVGRKEYSNKIRSVAFNLKDAKNPNLRRRLLSGELSPAALSSMNSLELANIELSNIRKSFQEKSMKKVALTAEAVLEGRGVTTPWRERTVAATRGGHALTDDAPVISDLVNVGVKRSSLEGSSGDLTASNPVVIDKPTKLQTKKMEDAHDAYVDLDLTAPPTPKREADRAELSLAATVWSGVLDLSTVAELPDVHKRKFLVSALHAKGPPLLSITHKDKVDSYSVKGRMNIDKLYEYLIKIQSSLSRLAEVVVFEPDDDSGTYEAAFNYLASHGKAIVMAVKPVSSLPRMEEVYILPIPEDANVPPTVQPVTHVDVEGKLVGVFIARQSHPIATQQQRILKHISKAYIGLVTN